MQKSFKEAEAGIEKVEKTAEKLDDTLSQTGESAAEAFVDTADNASNAASAFVDVQHGAENAVEAVNAVKTEINGVDAALDSLSGAEINLNLDSTGDSATDTIENAKENAEELSETLKETDESLKKVSDDGKSAFEETKKSTKKAKESVDGFNESLGKTPEKANGASDSIKKMAGTAASLAVLKEGIEATLSCFKEYADYESSVMRTSDIFGASADSITEFAETTAKSLGMSESSAYKYAATYGNLFKGITADCEENAKVTLAMLTTSATVASKTGRTMDDVMERIRSGLLGNTEAIEDLGIYVNVAMLETTDAFAKMANGRSWEQLEYQEQQQIRTLAILEQANKQFGTGVSKNTATSISALSGAFTDLRISAGALASGALLPLVQTLTYLAVGANSAVQWLGSLNGTSKTYLGIAAALALGIPAVSAATKGLAMAQAGLHAVQAILIPQTLTFGAVLKSALGWISLLALAIGVLYAIFGKNSNKEPASALNNYSDALENAQKSALNASKSINSVKDSTKELSNEIKRVLAGFDELNTLNSDGSTGDQSLLGFDTSGIDEAAIALGAFDDMNYNIDFDSNALTTTAGIEESFSEMWKNIKSGFSDWNRYWEGVGEDFYDIFHGNTEDSTEAIERMDERCRDIFGDKWTDFWEEKGEEIYDGFHTGSTEGERTLNGLNSIVRIIFGEGWKTFWEDVGEDMYTGIEEGDWTPLLEDFNEGVKLIFGEDWTTFWEEVGADIYDAFNGNADEAYTALEDLNEKIKTLFGEGWTTFWEGVGEKIYDALHPEEESEVTGGARSGGGRRRDSAYAEDWQYILAYHLSGNEYGVATSASEQAISQVKGQAKGVLDAGMLSILPKAAKGGIVERPTYLQAGEAGTEAILPLENNTGWLDKIADKISSNIHQTGATGDIIVRLEIGGRQFQQAVVKAVELNKVLQGGG